MSPTIREQVPRTSDVPAGLLASSSFICLCLAVLAIVVFRQTLFFEYIHLDDPDYVTANSNVLFGLTWDGIKWAFGAPHVANWHPVTWISLMLDMNLFGHRPFGPHTMNLLLHVGNTMLLFLVLKQLTGCHWRSALVAALFAVHPLHVESVAWVSERKDVLSGLFFFLALMSYTRYVQALKSKADGGQSQCRPPSVGISYGLTLLWFALGLLSKPMVVTLPFVLLLLDYWPLGRLWSDPAAGTSVPEGFSYRIFWRRVREKIPFFALSAVFCAITVAAQRGAVVSLAATPFAMRVGNTFVSYARYLAKTICPTDLAVSYPYPKQLPLGTLLLSAALIVGLTGLAIVLGRRHRFLVTGWFWFVGTLVPVIGLVQVGSQALADRYTYLPLIGVFIIVVWGIQELVTCWHLPKLAAASATVAVLAVCSARTVDQLHYWQNSEKLFRHSIQVTKDNYLALFSLASYLAENGRTDEAIQFYRQALEVSPEPAVILNNLAYLLAEKKQYSEAAHYYEEALRIKPDDEVTHCNLGVSLLELGKTNEAFAHCLEAARIAPGSPLVHYRVGDLLLRTGKNDDAIKEFQIALQLKPNYVNAWNALGVALLNAQRPDEAAAQFFKALEYHPENTIARLNLGNIFITQSNWNSASNQFAEALIFEPDSPDAHFGLARSLAALRDRAGAASNLLETLRLQPDYPRAKELLQLLQSQ